jgi:hypothetical protein
MIVEIIITKKPSQSIYAVIAVRLRILRILYTLIANLKKLFIR